MSQSVTIRCALFWTWDWSLPVILKTDISSQVMIVRIDNPWARSNTLLNATNGMEICIGKEKEDIEYGLHYLSGGTRCLKHWVSGVNIYTRHGNNWVSGATYFQNIYSHTRHGNNWVSGPTHFIVVFIAAPYMVIIGCLVWPFFLNIYSQTRQKKQVCGVMFLQNCLCHHQTNIATLKFCLL